MFKFWASLDMNLERILNLYFIFDLTAASIDCINLADIYDQKSVPRRP